MNFDLWPDFQGHVKRNLRLVPFQRLKLANFGNYAGDMDMGRCWEVTSMVYTDIVTFPRSTEVIRGQWPLMTSCHFSGFVPPGVIWCADYEFSIRLPLICVKMGSLGMPQCPKEKWRFLHFLFWPPSPKWSEGVQNFPHFDFSFAICSNIEQSTTDQSFVYFWPKIAWHRVTKTSLSQKDLVQFSRWSYWSLTIGRRWLCSGCPSSGYLLSAGAPRSTTHAPTSTACATPWLCCRGLSSWAALTSTRLWNVLRAVEFHHRGSRAYKGGPKMGVKMIFFKSSSLTR